VRGDQRAVASCGVGRPDVVRGDLPDLYRRAATYVDKIFKGAKPADLPVSSHEVRRSCQPENRQGAGLTIAPSLLLRADQVIE